MTQEANNFPPVFRIDVTAEPAAVTPSNYDPAHVIIALLRQLVAGQARQNKLLDDLLQHSLAVHKQRHAELGQWRDAHPELAKCCRTAAETLARVQTQFLYNLTEEVADNEDCLMDGEFMLNEFVDRYGPRLAHLNGVLQMLSQLSAVPNATETI